MEVARGGGVGDGGRGGGVGDGGTGAGNTGDGDGNGGTGVNGDGDGMSEVDGCVQFASGNPSPVCIICRSQLYIYIQLANIYVKSFEGENFCGF